MFEKAIPVWLADRENEVNLTLQLKAICPAAEDAAIRVATSGLYQLWINGIFVCCGPARAGKNHFRMDEISIGKWLTQPENAVVVEVCGCNAFSYELQKQPAFLQCEILANQAPILWTGRDFTARVHPFRRRKTQRYSFQRVLTESYNITGPDTFFTDPTPGPETPAPTAAKTIIPRLAPYPLYETKPAQPLFSGRLIPTVPEKLREDRSWLHVSEDVRTGYPIPELEVYPTAECQHFLYQPQETCLGGDLEAGTYTAYRLSHNMTGMLRFTVTCREAMTLYIQFDEVLTNGAIDYLRMECANALRYDLCPGTHHIQTFTVYTMQYLQCLAVGGGCRIENLEMVQYQHPPVSPTFEADHPAIQKITQAAIETFRQNAVDIFMDCPSRERAGWLCDSFFTSRVEYLLTGSSPIETSFLENFLHEEQYAALPDGMFPMCYPADHLDTVFIPQWAMWLVVQLREYRDRSQNRDLIRRYKHRVENLLAFFRGYENEDGLLEKLPSWNFVEWSMANQLTQDVNYPTNMLYSATLRAAAELYDEPHWAQKADAILQTIRRQSFDGEFFVDNALRQDGKLVLSGQRTEVCQYYAFFFGAATPQTHPKLLKTLVEDFGPNRAETGKWPEIYPANAFIGNYLRLDILTQLGYLDTVRENIEGYFLYMADKTGTLWENVGDTASCNHGFASYVLYWLDQIENRPA